MNKISIKGILLVAIGASSYGVVATFVKKGMADGYSTAELTFAQVIIGLIAVVLMNIISDKVTPINKDTRPTKSDKIKLLLGGIPLGLTSTFYYLSLQYIPVSVCIVMLMQSVWIGVVIDLLVNKIKPTSSKLVAICLVLVGTVFATNVLNADITLDWRGILWGFFAAMAYSLTFLSTNSFATRCKPLTRSMYLLIGSAITVSIVWGPSLIQKFDLSVLWTWGLIVAFFGTILPPLLFTKGMPLVGVGLGGIIASIELPVSVTMAYLLIDEPVGMIQWFGIILILSAIALMNVSFTQKNKGYKDNNHLSL